MVVSVESIPCDRSAKYVIWRCRCSCVCLVLILTGSRRTCLCEVSGQSGRVVCANSIRHMHALRIAASAVAAAAAAAMLANNIVRNAR